MLFSQTIDGNYIMSKNAFMMKGVRADDEVDELNKNKLSFDDYSKLLFNDVNRIVRLFPYDRIFFVYESGSSWRKDFYPEYKENRKDKDDDIDWKEIYRRFNDFLIEAPQKFPHISFIKYNKAEGDDIILYLTIKLNSLGYSNTIISRDKDLTQLVYFRSGEFMNFQLTVNKADEKIYLPINYNYFLSNLINHKKETQDLNIFDNEDDVFNISSSSSVSLEERYISHIEEQLNKCKKVEILSSKTTFIKVVAGDKGDNVRSCYIKYKDEQDLKGRGIGEDGAEKVYENYVKTYGVEINFKSLEFVDNLANVISYMKKIKDDDVLNKIKADIKRNIRLVYLDTACTPKELKTNLINEIQKLF